MQDFKKLKIWEKAHSLTLSIYKNTGNFPKSELYGLTSQLRRASASIPANIAEGCGRGGNKELKHFLYIAMGSASELEYHLILSRDLEYLKSEVYNALNEELLKLKKMLNIFIKKVGS